MAIPLSITLQLQMTAIAIFSILSLGIISCAVSSQANHWWNKYSGKSVITVAQTINDAENPLVLTNTRGILAMSANFKPSIPIYWINTDRVQQENLGYTHPLSSYSDIFWYSANYRRSQELINFFQQSDSFHLQTVINEIYKIEPTFSTTAHLYKIVLQKTTLNSLN